MLYPDQLIQCTDNLQLYIPDPEVLKSYYEAAIARDPATPFPYWARIWPSAMALTRFLQEELHWVKDKNVLELGAGIGLPSFSIASHTRQLTISDRNPDAVVLLQKNRDQLKVSHVQVRQLDWNHLPDPLDFDTVLLSDVNYVPADFPGLLENLQVMLNMGITILLSTPQRLMAIPFAEAIRPWVRRSVDYDTGFPDNTRVRIYVLSLSFI